MVPFSAYLLIMQTFKAKSDIVFIARKQTQTHHKNISVKPLFSRSRFTVLHLCTVTFHNISKDFDHEITKRDNSKST